MESLELEMDKAYLKSKRDDLLGRFNELIKSMATHDTINNCYNHLLVMQKQLGVMEDAIDPWGKVIM